MKKGQKVFYKLQLPQADGSCQWVIAHIQSVEKDEIYTVKVDEGERKVFKNVTASSLRPYLYYKPLHGDNDAQLKWLLSPKNKLRMGRKTLWHKSGDTFLSDDTRTSVELQADSVLRRMSGAGVPEFQVIMSHAGSGDGKGASFHYSESPADGLYQEMRTDGSGVSEWRRISSEDGVMQEMEGDVPPVVAAFISGFLNENGEESEY